MTMKQGFYTFAIGLVIQIVSVESTTWETVWLKDATEKRTLSNIDLPDELAFDLTRRSETMNLSLRRNHDINPNADVYFARKSQNGNFVLGKSRHIERENLAYYQDVKNGAFVTVRCVKKSNEQCDRIINGNVRIRGRDYAIHPAETDAKSRYVLEDPGVLGRQYVLQIETHPLGYDAFGNKDAAQEIDKNTEQRFMSLLRSFNKGHKQKHLSPVFTTLSSTNVSTLYNRGERVINADKSRKSPRTYHVKVAVVIDRALWAFYYEMVPSLTPRVKTQHATQLIHQYYSHIMNGVNMLYKGISDPSIRINVILNQFIIWKSRSDFRHDLSSIIPYKGLDHIDERLYLEDIINWDNKTAMKDQPSFSHGMVFTSYKLYENDLDNAESHGLCYVGKVCSIGKRMSLVQRRDYVLTVRTAAHELGHSLGALHDGDAGAAACKAEDSFIMSPRDFPNHPGQRYNKNPWLFSTCSIEAFKKTLPNKECVHHVGPFYNSDEYHKFISEMPGKVFPIDHQCELILGQKSILCETALKDICLLMRCTDPHTRICLPSYYGAARGTECGKDMWCIDGRCVAKR